MKKTHDIESMALGLVWLILLTLMLLGGIGLLPGW
jgi:hypothetical protein